MVLAALTYIGTTCLDRNQYPDVCVCWEGRGIMKTSIYVLCYVPACVSSLMQSPCPPNVTHKHAGARTQTVSGFLLSTKAVIAAAFQGVSFPRSLSISFLCVSVVSLLFSANRAPVHLILSGLPRQRVLAESLGN